MVKHLLMVLFLTFGAYNNAACESAHEPESQRAAAIVDTWSLENVDGADPSSINIRTYEIVFEQGGTWQYEAKMSGPYEGMELKA